VPQARVSVRNSAAAYTQQPGEGVVHRVQQGPRSARALDLSTCATSPIWSIVDGPWKLSAFNADGHVTFVPNKSYTGPVKPKLAAFSEVPFTADSSEYDVLRSPSSSTKIDVGYLPQQDAPAAARTSTTESRCAGRRVPPGHCPARPTRSR
jgi:hypothetical protein